MANNERESKQAFFIRQKNIFQLIIYGDKVSKKNIANKECGEQLMLKAL